MSHWDTLMALESYIADRVLPEVMPPPSFVELPHYMTSPAVGGLFPPSGPRRETLESVHQAPYNMQAVGVRRYRRRVPMPADLGGYY